ncbi:MAG: hypothetical protein JW871_03400 [Endomicrobiales bacterium]|nr:hypothetical protein [Endomicrobiales bacterium]
MAVRMFNAGRGFSLAKYIANLKVCPTKDFFRSLTLTPGVGVGIGVYIFL